MSIKIAERFRPFTHVPGAKIILPGTSTSIQVYPTKVIVADKEYPVPVVGLVDKFTALLDLEKGKVVVSGVASGQFFSFVVDEMGTHPEREVALQPTPQERLSFGCTKQQNFEKIYQRCDLSEFLPLWFFAGQHVPQQKIKAGKSMLKELETAIHAREIVAVKKYFEELFKIGFTTLFHPAKEDVHHFGASLELLPKGAAPAALLSEGYKLIRSCLVEEKNDLHILPLALTASGRATGLQLSIGLLDIEWTKHRLKRVVLTATQSGPCTLHFPKDLSGARLNYEEKLIVREIKLQLHAGKTYHFDHFTH